MIPIYPKEDRLELEKTSDAVWFAGCVFDFLLNR
jgi:hypothetical protein